MARRKSLAAGLLGRHFLEKLMTCSFRHCTPLFLIAKISRVACLAVYGIAFTYRFDSPGWR
jgi:hypothetical protein